MAQSAANLTVSVGIDTAKLRADAAIVKAELQGITKELNAAAKAGDINTVRAKAAQQDALVRKLREYNLQLRDTTRATSEAEKSTSELGKKVFELGDHFGVALGGVRLLRLGLAGLAAVETVRAITAVVDKLNELNQAARDAGTNPATLKSVREAFERIGEDGKRADSMLTTASKTLHEWQLAQIQAGQSTAQGVQMLKGNVDAATRSIQDFQMVARGGDRRPIEFGITAGVTTLQQRAKEILAIKDPILADEQAMKSFGGTVDQVRAGLEDLAKGPKIGPTISPEQQKAADDYNKSMVELKNTWDELGKTTVFQVLGLVNNELIADLKTVNDIIEAFKNLGAVLAGLEKKLPSWLTRPLPEVAGEAATAVGQYLKTTLGSETTAAPSSHGRGTPPTIVEPTPQTPAAGGYIRGPGSATSDSIPARLSNGEYVINARSVSRLGVGLLHRLNRFAGGGYVDREGVWQAGDFDPSAFDFDPDRPSYTSAARPRYQAARYQATPASARDPKKRAGRLVTPELAQDPRSTAMGYGARAGEEPLSVTSSTREAPGGIRVGGSDPTERMRRATQFMRALTGFPEDYLGSPVKFAKGGLVGADGGGRAMAIFNFEQGQSFKLGGPVDVVNAMVKAAHGQQIKSAGTKPSWFAGRPGGK